MRTNTCTAKQTHYVLFGGLFFSLSFSTGGNMLVIFLRLFHVGKIYIYKNPSFWLSALLPTLLFLFSLFWLFFPIFALHCHRIFQPLKIKYQIVYTEQIAVPNYYTPDLRHERHHQTDGYRDGMREILLLAANHSQYMCIMRQPIYPHLERKARNLLNLTGSFGV